MRFIKKVFKFLFGLAIFLLIVGVVVVVFHEKIESYLTTHFENNLEQQLEEMFDVDDDDGELDYYESMYVPSEEYDDTQEITYTEPVRRPFEVHFIDVGQADSILVTYGTGTMLIDGGNVDDGQKVVQYISDLGITELNYVVCTHAHEDHVGGLTAVINSFTVTDAVFAPETGANSKCYQDFVNAVESSGMTITHLAGGQSFYLDDLYNCCVDCFGPLTESYSDINNTSIVLKVSDAYSSFLFTGDAELDAETDMLECAMFFKADVLKVGHHGSSSSTGYRWLREVQPKYAVISCGAGNKYGHPTEATLSRLRDADVQVYRTDMQGTIVATASADGITFRVEKNPDAITNPVERCPYYIGNTNSMKFHRPSCSSLPKEENRCIFNTIHEAYDAGYEPCGYCNP